MFARTPVAKAFRKWVLDVIERYGDRVPVDAQTPPTGTLSRISSRTIAGELHKRHSTVLDAISRAAAVCPQRDAFVRGNYVDAKGQRCPQYMVSREGIIFLSQSYAARQTDAWRNILDTLSTVPEVITRRPVPQRLPGLPATERLFADIEKALFALDGTENWTHITVRRELSGIGSVRRLVQPRAGAVIAPGRARTAQARITVKTKGPIPSGFRPFRLCCLSILQGEDSV